MKKILNYIMLLLITLVFSSVSFGKNYRNKNVIVRETKVLTLKKNYKGNILYILKKGRYKIRILPNTVDYVEHILLEILQKSILMILRKKAIYMR